MIWVLVSGAALAAAGFATVNRATVSDMASIGVALFGAGMLAMLIALAVLLMDHAHARDLDGRYAQSPLKPWFDSLKSGKGPCCSDADGTALSDVDWKSKDGKYQVRIDGQWIVVPDDAVISEPNRAGRTMVWPIRGYLGIDIRCFMPGSMT